MFDEQNKYGGLETVFIKEEKARCETLSGQKLENTWLGRDNDESQGHTLDRDEKGNYIILIEKEAEKKALMENA